MILFFAKCISSEKKTEKKEKKEEEKKKKKKKRKRKKEAILHQWKENETSFCFCSLSSDQTRGGRSYLYIHICIP